jgi:hypothetical protein
MTDPNPTLPAPSNPVMAHITDWQSRFLSDAIAALTRYDERRAADLITESMRARASWRYVCSAMVCTGGCAEVDDGLILPYVRVEVDAAGVSIDTALDIDMEANVDAELEAYADLLVPAQRTVAMVTWHRPMLVLCHGPNGEPMMVVGPSQEGGSVLIQKRRGQ